MASLDSTELLSDEVISRFDFIKKRTDALYEPYKNFDEIPLPINYKLIIKSVKNSDKLHAF